MQTDKRIEFGERIREIRKRLYISQKDFTAAIGSLFKSCEQFEACHKINGVCWKQVIIAYGYDKWDYPDPRCPKAPKPVRRFWLE
jgi:hypothetical protein